jgi:hypothetical protein
MALRKKTADTSAPPSRGATAVPSAKKPGRVAQIRQVFSSARAVDPTIGWWMVLVAVAVIVVFEIIGLLLGHWLYFLVISIPLAMLAAVLVLSRRAERAAYRQIEGQPGATGAALSSLRRGWYYDQQPVAGEAQRPGDMTSAALVFRATGRPGVVLVAEGPAARASRLAEAERKRVARVAPGVPITVLRVGDGADQISVRKLNSTMQRMKPVLTKDEAAAVNKRLKALGGARPAIPAGVDPNRIRMDRKAMRGR